MTSMVPMMLALSWGRPSAGIQYSRMVCPPGLVNLLIVEERLADLEPCHVSSAGVRHVPVAAILVAYSSFEDGVEDGLPGETVWPGPPAGVPYEGQFVWADGVGTG
jgi:hypothetical protein